MEENNNDHRLVRLSTCKVCNNLFTAMALEVIDGKSLTSFDKEVKKYDLNVETITLKEFKDRDMNFCNCD